MVQLKFFRNKLDWACVIGLYHFSGDQSLEESKGQDNYFKDQNTDDDTTETNKLSEADYQKQLSTIVEWFYIYFWL